MCSSSVLILMTLCYRWRGSDSRVLCSKESVRVGIFYIYFTNWFFSCNKLWKLLFFLVVSWYIPLYHRWYIVLYVLFNFIKREFWSIFSFYFVWTSHKSFNQRSFEYTIGVFILRILKCNGLKISIADNISVPLGQNAKVAMVLGTC